jgi:dTDP-4-dehydrorhamnose reductase
LKAAIFGAGGQVGRALAATAPAGAEVFAFDRGQCDIRSAEEIERALALAKPRIVFNAAAFTGVERAEAEPDAAQALNADAAGLLAAEARAAGARTVHISTDYVFDGAAEHPYRPDDPPNPINVYGRTKLAGEAAVLRAAPDALIVRTQWLHSDQGANFVTSMLRLMREKSRLCVVRDQAGTPTSARALARALWTLAAAGTAGTLHYRDSGTTTWYGFAVAIQEEAAALGLLPGTTEIVPIVTADYPTPARRPIYAVLDAGDAWKLLGQPAPHWRETLQHTLKEISARG